MSLRAALLVVVLALAAAGCGSADDAAPVSAPVGATAAAAPGPAPTSSEPATTTAPAAATTASKPAPTVSAPSSADPGGASADEAQPGGAGDEEAIRQPVLFTVGAGSVTPVSVSVAPFLAVALTVVNRSAAARAVRLVGADVSFDVPAGGRVQRRLAGLRAGTYTLSVDGGETAASLVVGDDAGP